MLICERLMCIFVCFVFFVLFCLFLVGIIVFDGFFLFIDLFGLCEFFVKNVGLFGLLVWKIFFFLNILVCYV